MIIKRKFETYGQLSREAASRQIIAETLEKYNVKKFIIDNTLDPYNDLIFCNTDMSCCLPCEAFQEIETKFEELDKGQPYDNGFTYNDVSGVMTYPSRKGTAVVQVLYNKKVEMPVRIVQIVAFETKDGKTYFIEPWDIGRIIL